MTLLQLFKSGGIVMWPLLFISITSLACIFERLSYWKSSFTRNDKILDNILKKYSDIDSIEDLRTNNITYLPLEKVLFKVLNIIEKIYPDRRESIDVKIALEISIKSIQSEFGKFSNLFSTVITISPLLGLLGTVLGLINSFSFIRIGGSDINSLEVTGGISEALISTAFGLIVAIFTLAFSNYFNSLWKKQNSILNQYCGKFEMLFNKIHK